VPQSFEVPLDILQQRSKSASLMIMRDLPSCPAPQPLDPIGIWVIGGRIDEPQTVGKLRQHLTHQSRPARGMGTQIVDEDDGYAPSGPRPGDGGPDLGAKNISGASWSQSAVKPALTPINEAETIDLVVGPGRLDQALPPSAFATPDAGQGRMERKLDFILQIEISLGQEGEQFFQVWRHFMEQVRLYESSHGWRGWRANPGQHHLHPQAFPT
jgi:hypothetical protein